MAAKRKRVTLNEFKAWLEGVEELQDSNWTPTHDQWVLIRNKMNNIKEDPLQAKTPQSIVNNIIPPVKQNVTNIPGIPPPPEVRGLPQGPVVMTPEAQAMLTDGPGNGVTPNIDTSDGTYKSSFN